MWNLVERINHIVLLPYMAKMTSPCRSFPPGWVLSGSIKYGSNFMGGE